MTAEDCITTGLQKDMYAHEGRHIYIYAYHSVQNIVYNIYIYMYAYYRVHHGQAFRLVDFATTLSYKNFQL